MRFWVSETTQNIPSEIFIYQRTPQVPLYDEPTDLFVHIGTYSDLIELDADEPEEGNVFFRKSSVDITFNSIEKLERKWIRIRAHINILIEDIVRLNKLPPVEVIFVDLESNIKC